MKLAFIAAILFATAGAVHAQSAGSSSDSAATSSVASANTAVVGVSVSDNRTYNSDGETTIRSAPAVSAPGVFGGGHPCLAGKSGGVSVIGGGISYGQGDPEPACMLWLMNQPEAALMVMASTSQKACRAMGKVGFIRIGETIVPFQCGDAPASARTSPQARPVGYSKCVKDGNKVRISYKSGANKPAAKAACLASLGY